VAAAADFLGEKRALGGVARTIEALLEKTSGGTLGDDAKDHGRIMRVSDQLGSYLRRCLYVV